MLQNDLGGVKVINLTVYLMCTYMLFVRRAVRYKRKMFFVDFTLCGIFFHIGTKRSTLRLKLRGATLDIFDIMNQFCCALKKNI